MRNRWPVLLLATAVAVALLSVAGTPTTDTARAAPEQLTCSWQNIGSNTKELFHTAAAFDTDNNKMYIYGGVGADYSVQNSVEVGDLSQAQLRVQWRTVSAGTARALVASAGAYRAKGADSDLSAAYFVGGMANPQTGKGDNEVQRYLVKAGRWERLAVSNANDFADRAFASAAYDPIHDVIWVVGGVATCALPTVMTGGQCNARPIATQYLSWDATTGEAKWNTLANGNQSYYAASMVYDAGRSRMLIYGGTDNIAAGRGEVVALDLSDPDPAKALLSAVNATGRGPSTYMHGGAYFADRDWMVVYGGVRQNFMQQGESVESSTYALDLAANPPAWTDIKPSGSPGTRVGGVMGYDPIHKAAVFSLGRDKSDGDVDTVEKIQRVTYALTCSQAYPPPTTPTTPVTPGASPTTPVAPPTTVTPGGGPTAINTPVNTPINTPVNTPVNTAVPQPTFPPSSEVCDYARKVVPASVLAAALASPQNIWGYHMLCQPNLAPSPWNVERRHLGIDTPSKPFHPIYNTVVWKCGCP